MGRGRSMGGGGFSRRGLSSSPPPKSTTSLSKPAAPSTTQQRTMSKTMAPSAAKSSQTKNSTAQMQKPTTGTSTPSTSTRPASSVAPQPATGGSPGLMTQILANAASTAGGVVAAHAIMGALGMKGHGPVEQNGEINPQVAQEMERAANGPCAVQFEALTKCADANPDIGNCQWAADMFKDCRESKMAPAPQFSSDSSLPSYNASRATSDISREKNW